MLFLEIGLFTINSDFIKILVVFLRPRSNFWVWRFYQSRFFMINLNFLSLLFQDCLCTFTYQKDKDFAYPLFFTFTRTLSNFSRSLFFTFFTFKKPQKNLFIRKINPSLYYKKVRKARDHDITLYQNLSNTPHTPLYNRNIYIYISS